jgi:hypothetical protein
MLTPLPRPRDWFLRVKRTLKRRRKPHLTRALAERVRAIEAGEGE